MIYDPSNVELPCDVYDWSTKEKLLFVLTVDTAAREVKCAHQPARLNDVGEIDTFTLRYTSIYPTFDKTQLPVAFQCYGRQA